MLFPILPRRFYTRSRPFVRILTVAHFCKKTRLFCGLLSPSCVARNKIVERPKFWGRGAREGGDCYLSPRVWPFTADWFFGVGFLILTSSFLRLLLLLPREISCIFLSRAPRPQDFARLFFSRNFFFRVTHDGLNKRGTLKHTCATHEGESSPDRRTPYPNKNLICLMTDIFK